VALMIGIAWLINRYVERLLAPRIRTGLRSAFAAAGRWRSSPASA
jgi:hypothetical protein